VRVRASAGAASFRREATLDRHLAMAQAVVEDLKREVEAGSDASNQRIEAARERAGTRAQRADRGGAESARGNQAQRQEREEKRPNGKKPKEPRASTTDAEARVMKMADGGFRPAYNVQVASAAGEQIVVAVEVCNTGSDRGSCGQCWNGLHAQNGRFPERHLADGGFCSARTSNGRMTKRLRPIVRPLNPSTAPIPICRVAAMARECWLGGPGWRAKLARHGTNLAPSANASMPAGATGTCGN